MRIILIIFLLTMMFICSDYKLEQMDIEQNERIEALEQQFKSSVTHNTNTKEKILDTLQAHDERFEIYKQTQEAKKLFDEKSNMLRVAQEAHQRLQDERQISDAELSKSLAKCEITMREMKKAERKYLALSNKLKAKRQLLTRLTEQTRQLLRD